MKTITIKNGVDDYKYSFFIPKQNSSFRKYAIALFLLISVASNVVIGQLFQQQFSTNLTSFSNSNSSNPTYINSNPSNSQFTYLGSSGSGSVISITNNKLTMTRSGSGWGFARASSFTGSPTTLMIQFEYSTIEATSAATSTVVFGVGGGNSFASASTSLIGADTHSRFSINCTNNSGEFIVRDIAGSTNGTSTFTGTQTILFVINNSGSATTYKAPDGTIESVEDDKFDVWVGTSKQLNDRNATTNTQTLSYFKCISTTGTQIVNFGNVLIDPIPTSPTSTAATNNTSSGFQANWATVAGVTGYRLDISTTNDFTNFVSGYNNLYIDGQSTNSRTINDLNPNTAYYYRVRAVSQYTTSEFSSGNSNYQTTATLSFSSSSSDIILNSAFVYSNNINYQSYQGTTPLTTSNSVEIGQFIIRDGGNTADSDILATILTGLSLNVTNHSNLNRIALFDGETNLKEVAANASSILTDLYIAATDNSSKTFSIRVSFLPSVIDNQQISVAINSATTSDLGSAFANANAGGAVTSTSGDNNRIEVTASQLLFIQQPTGTIVGCNMMPAPVVKAVDSNGNTDLDYNSIINITSSGNLNSSPQSVVATAGAATFEFINHSTSGSGIALTASSGLLAGTVSTIFNAVAQPAGILLLEENFNSTAGTDLTANGWIAHSGAGTNSIKHHTNGLNYSEYGSTGIGNSAIINSNGEDVNRTFAQQGTGSTTYCAFLIHVSSARSTDDYIVHLGSSPMTNEFRCKLFTKNVAGNLLFGISTNGNSIVYTSSNSAFDTTYLIVLKHFYNSTTSTSSLFINPSLQFEPTNPDATETSSLTSTNIGSIALRQSSASNVAIIDGIRIATNWGALMGNVIYDNATNINAGNYNSITVINGGTPTQVGNIATNNITIYSGGTLHVDPARQLTVSTTLINNGTLNLKSDTTGTATILTPANLSGTGTYNVQQQLSTSRNWYVSSPVSLATRNIFNGLTDYVYSFSESSGTWITKAVGESLEIMKGYVAHTVSNGIVTFTGGALNSGDIALTGLTATPGNYRGFHLIGNPYPSYLDFDSSIKNNVMSSAWFRTKNNTNGNYVYDTYGSLTGQSTNNSGRGAVTKDIAPMQAFWICVNEGGNGSITFSNGMRSHKDQSAICYRLRTPAQDAQKVVRLRVSNGTSIDEAILVFNTEASNNLDEYDSPKMPNDSVETPEIYTLVENKNLVINGMNSISENMELALGFKTGSINNFTIKATEIQNIDPNIEIVLKDKELNLEQVLTPTTDYSFASGIANTCSRFSIKFRTKSELTNVNNPAHKMDIVIYDHTNGQIAIQRTLADKAIINVNNALGQLIYKTTINGTTTVLRNKFNTGFYFVSVQLEGKTVTQKVFIK